MKELLFAFLEKHPSSKEFFIKLCSVGDVFLIGGVLREYKDHADFISLRDIDIAIQVDDDLAYNNLVKEFSLYKNRLGGHKLFFEDLLIDVWRIEDTWAYKQGVIECSPSEYASRLTDTVFLNIDGIVYDWNRGIWYDKTYEMAMGNGVIDVVLPENPLIPLNILRAFILKKRYNMSLSYSLEKIIIAEYLKFETLSDFIYALLAEQNKRYEKRILQKDEIEKEVLTIINR